jgi:membrane protein
VLAEEPGFVERAATRVVAVFEPLVARILGVPRIGMAHQVYSRYAAASGPVLARGLAFGALFALVPALLVVLSIAGFFVQDPALRDQIVEIVADQVPPLAPLIEEVLKNVGSAAAASGLIGIVLLVWSASGLVRALDGAFRVVFEDDGEGRTPIRDVITVIAVAGGVFGAALLLVLLVLPSPLSEVIGAPGIISSGGLSVVGIAAVLGLAYRFVPRPRPTWRLLALPTLLVSLAIWLLTTLFAVLGPLLFGSVDLYGAFGSLFLGLIWLSYVTQLLLLGAAWIAERDRRARAVRPADEEARGI